MAQLHLPHSSLRFRFPCLPSLYRRHAAWSLKPPTLELNSTDAPVFRPLTVVRSRFSESEITPKSELGKSQDKRKPQKEASGIFWIMLINLGIYVADHFFKVRSIKSLYVYHRFPAWYQFVTATFCHDNWYHLSGNLVFMYIFGKIVEEENGNFGLWLSYLFTGVGAHLVSWLLLPPNAVSVGASGAVFGLFAISVLVKISWDWRKFLEVLILGQFIVTWVVGAAQTSAGLAELLFGRYGRDTFFQPITKSIAHFSGALVGVVLVSLRSKNISEPVD